MPKYGESQPLAPARVLLPQESLRRTECADAVPLLRRLKAIFRNACIESSLFGLRILNEFFKPEKTRENHCFPLPRICNSRRIFVEG